MEHQKACTFFQKGKCTRGKNCTFPHLPKSGTGAPAVKSRTPSRGNSPAGSRGRRSASGSRDSKGNRKPSRSPGGTRTRSRERRGSGSQGRGGSPKKSRSSSRSPGGTRKRSPSPQGGRRGTTPPQRRTKGRSSSPGKRGGSPRNKNGRSPKKGGKPSHVCLSLQLHNQLQTRCEGQRWGNPPQEAVQRESNLLQPEAKPAFPLTVYTNRRAGRPLRPRSPDRYSEGSAYGPGSSRDVSPNLPETYGRQGRTRMRVISRPRNQGRGRNPVPPRLGHPTNERGQGLL